MMGKKKKPPEGGFFAFCMPRGGTAGSLTQVYNDAPSLRAIRSFMISLVPP